jgi:hypothetical protein
MFPVPFGTQAYKSLARPLAAQRLVNYFPERTARQAKEPFTLLARPGLDIFSIAGNGPVRGQHVMNETHFVVSGPDVYRIDAAGVPFLLGQVAGEGTVKMADNGTQLAIAAGENGYIYDGLTLEQIVDEAFGDVIDVVFLKGYFIWIKARSRQFFISGLYDGKSYDSLEFATAETTPNDLLGAIVDHQVILFFKSSDIEIWWNSGNADFPFEPVAGGQIERGLLAAESVVRLDNSIFWLGVGPEGGVMVFRNDGFRAARVSTHIVEAEIESYSLPSQAVAFGFTMEGHSFYVLTFPGRATWVHDATTDEWLRWESQTAENAPLGTWRVLRHAYVYGKHIMSCCDTGALFEASRAFQTDAGKPIRCIATTTLVQADRELVVMNRFELDVLRGVGLTSGQGSDPQAVLRWSDDGGKTWSNELWRGFGKKGECENRAIWTRMGQFRERVIEITISDPVIRGLVGGYTDVEVSVG